MKKLKLGLVLGLAVLLVSVFALPGPAAQLKKKCGDGGPLIQGPMVIEYPLSCQISCEGVCRITTLPFTHSLQPPLISRAFSWVSWKARIRPSRD